MLRIINAAQTLDRLRPFFPGINLRSLREWVGREILNFGGIEGPFESRISYLKSGETFCVTLERGGTLIIESLSDRVEVIDWRDKSRLSSTGRVRVTVI